MNPQEYLDIAGRYMGIDRYKDIEVLNTFWQEMKLGGYKNKPEIAWCSAFVWFCLSKAGLDVKTDSPYCKENSQYWLHYGEKVEEPYLGSIAVFRYAHGGHVGFVVGINQNHNPVILGGNQNNKVTSVTFNKANLVEYRHPIGVDRIKLVPDNSQIVVVNTR